jgi:hypothetical protein
MPRIRIPRTCPHRRDMTYAKLLLRVYPHRSWNAFDGSPVKPGALVDESALWPTAEYPETPLLLEYAGNDHSGRGHNRSLDIYLLWRYDRAQARWTELMRCKSQGLEWIESMKPVALQELARTAPAPDPWTADRVSILVLSLLDIELEKLGPAERHLAMSFVYQEFSARVLAYAA